MKTLIVSLALAFGLMAQDAPSPSSGQTGAIHWELSSTAPYSVTLTSGPLPCIEVIHVRVTFGSIDPETGKYRKKPPIQGSYELAPGEQSGLSQPRVINFSGLVRETVLRVDISTQKTPDVGCHLKGLSIP